MEKKYFSKYRASPMALPNLVEIQTESYGRFLKEGLRALLCEVSPIKDYNETEFNLDLVDYSLDEPKCDEYFAKAHNLSYEAPLRAKVRLTNKQTKEVKEQEIFLADLPLMTDHGTFVINGVERVFVSQLSRSFGVYFSVNILRGEKYFGAKIIPSRGAWLEMETELDNAIYVRIDRKRKLPVSVLLKVFGFSKNSEIEEVFSKIDIGERRYLKSTLEKDPTANPEEAYLEVYKCLRPGEPAAPDTAKEFIDAMFGPERYDLSAVGRYKFNRRLNLPTDKIKESPKTLSRGDLVAVISNIINSNNNPLAEPDDIDHLGNRRIRTVGELLEQRLRVGLARLRRIAQDRMSTLDPVTLTSAQLVNARPFAAVLKEFFMTNQLSQFMSQQNILSELEHLRRLSAMGPGGLTRERAKFEVRDVHPSYYGRICPIETPEGPNIGLIVYIASYAKINEFGLLETPYRKVKNGKVTSEIVYMTAFEEIKHNIAHAGVAYDEKTGQLLEEEIEARIKGRPGLASKEDIDYIDLASNQSLSIATSLIPFLEHDDANRALMGSNMQRQAVPCLIPEAPLVATGIEERIAADSGRLVLASEPGTVSHVDSKEIRIRNQKGKEKIYPLVNFKRTNEYTVVNQRPTVNLEDRVSKGDILADTSSSDKGQLALGQNILVAFLSWHGLNFEDAIIVSERLVRADKFTSVHIEDFTVKVRDTKLGPEETTCDIPNVSEEKLRNLDEEGIIRIGAEVKSNDLLVGKVTPKGETELTPEERLLRSIFGEKAKDVKDTSLRLPHGKEGRVISVEIFSRERGDKLDTGVIKEIRVEIAELRKISVGDKLAGRHGNKGVVSKVLAIEDMPCLEDGTPVDIILNPLGVASRMNIGQILETHLGLAAKTLGYQAVVPAFQSATDDEIKDELEKAGFSRSGKVRLYDGQTGEFFEEPLTVGYLYMMKLSHMVEDKIHMRSTGPYSLITQQPLGGKAQGGGQRFGEMEVWALEGYGAAYTLQEMLTIKSDDVLGRAAAYEAIVRNEDFKSPHLPASFYVLVNELKGLALDVELKEYPLASEPPVGKREARAEKRTYALK